MWQWLDRRKHSRREEDLQLRMKDAIEAKHQAALAAMAQLKQFSIDRRVHALPVILERRKA